MPAARIFIDSTTFLYTFDRSERDKGAVALDWLTTLRTADSGITNLQVLNEVARLATRKSDRFGDDAFSRVDTFAIFGSEPMDSQTAHAGRSIFRTYRYSWWDCLLLASALELDCTHFLSEDLQDGQRIVAGDGRGLTIVDPFAHSPAEFLSS